MARAIRMPQPGQMTEECTVLQWFKAEGDSISKGDALFEIETDKSNMEVEAFDEGTLLQIVVSEGHTVPVDAVVAWIGQPGEAIPEVDAAPAVAAAAGGEASGAAADVGDASGPAADVDPGVAAEAQEPSQIGAFPPDDGAAAPQVAAPEVAEAPEVPNAAEAGKRLTISPRASRVAAELGVDPSKVTGTGPGGRIVERDVRAAAIGTPEPGATELESTATATVEPDVKEAASTPAGDAAPAGTPATPIAAAAEDAAADDAGEPLSRIRKVIARRLTESVTTIPHYTVTVVVDMTDAMALRAELKPTGSRVTVTDFIHAATVQALMELPMVNSRTDGKSVWKRGRVHLGVAVSIPDGLLVPVIRDADSLSISGLHDRTATLVEAARAGSLGPDELSGSTFTVSNMGMFGVEQFSAIINPGESGILAVSSVKAEPAVVGDGIGIRQLMRITLSADHRLVDGELGARFVNAIKHRLEDTGSLRGQL